jgi:DNA-binding transcriptional MerR regulator
MNDLTIGEIARRAGLKASAIRYYEASGLLPASPRKSGRRLYDATILTRLGVVAMAKTFGFSLAEIKTLLAALDSSTPPKLLWRKFAEEKLDHIEAQIQSAKRLRTLLKSGLECKCLTIADCAKAVKTVKTSHAGA